MNVTETRFFKEFVKLCDNGYKKGWHERNGGNLSYRLKETEVELIKDDISLNGEFKDIAAHVPSLSNEFFLVTGSGKFMMNVKEDPFDTTCIIHIDEKGEKYQICWGLINGGRPTSELPTHLMNHAVVKRKTENKFRLIYHCHATNVIALTFVLPLDSITFTRELWEMSTECSIVFPRGVGVVPWMVPGQEEIAIESSKLMEKYDAVIWAHHGIFCAGEDFNLTWGLVETIEKSAEILVKVMSMKDKKLQTITKENFKMLEKPFNVKLNEEVLASYDKNK